MRTVRTKQRPVVRGEYSRNGYEIWCAGRVLYSAGNHVKESTQYATTERDRLPLKIIRRFCIKTAHEIAAEQNGAFGGVERVAEDAGQVTA
jgi:hypothetical protein